MSIKTWTEWGASHPALVALAENGMDIYGGYTLSRHWGDERVPEVLMRISDRYFRTLPLTRGPKRFSIVARLKSGRAINCGSWYETFEEALAVAKAWYEANKSTLYGYPVELNNTTCLEFSHD